MALRSGRAPYNPYAPDGPVALTPYQEPEPTLSRVALALLAIVVAKGRAHAYEIVREVEKNGGAFGASETTIYRTLNQLERDGFLSSVPGAIGRRPVKLFRSTDRGERALERSMFTTINDRPELSSAEIVAKVRAARTVPRSFAHGAMRRYAEQLADDLADLGYEERQARRKSGWDEVLALEYRLRHALLRDHLEFTEAARDFFAEEDRTSIARAELRQAEARRREQAQAEASSAELSQASASAGPKTEAATSAGQTTVAVKPPGRKSRARKPAAPKAQATADRIRTKPLPRERAPANGLSRRCRRAGRSPAGSVGRRDAKQPADWRATDVV